ncbi:MAG: nucleotidyltransferase domain-containing protein [Actinobacteria bacterium]|nr:nucleotidyltransferase domain-containing protein [Actinomycetota bacterium]
MGRAAGTWSTRGPGHVSASDNQAGVLDRDELLAEIVRRLVDAYDPTRIYLFGSRARGDAGPDSDYDIMVVVPDSASPPRRRSRLAYQVLWGLREAGDILVWTEGQFEGTKHLRSSLPGTVLREGRLLHAA